MKQRVDLRARIRFLFVVGAVLLFGSALAQTNELPNCCPTGFIEGDLFVRFVVGTTRERVDEIAADLGLQVTRFRDNILGPLTSLCVPLGEESAFVTKLIDIPEVISASTKLVFCIPELPDCQCSPCGFSDPSLPPCDPDCESDPDGDRFSYFCDTCTDTDGDGFGNPGFEENPLGIPIATCPTDNCADLANPDQADLDMDGVGDVCDGGLTICHAPPGNPARAHTITIATPAWPAHMQHGDVPGACQAQEGRRRGRDRPPVAPRTSRPATFQKAGQQLNF